MSGSWGYAVTTCKGVREGKGASAFMVVECEGTDFAILPRVVGGYTTRADASTSSIYMSTS